MKKLVALVLALLTLAMPCLSMAVEYPVNADETVVIWKVLDGSIAEGGYTTSMDTPGFKAWVEAAGINVTLQEYADNNALLLAIAGASTLPDAYMINKSSYAGGVMGMVADDITIEITPEMLTENAPDYWEYVNNDTYLSEIVQIDGNMYGLAGHVFEPGSVYRYWRGLFYRGDLLEKVNKEVPKTADELYELLVALKSLDGVTTPMVFQGKDDLRESLRNGDKSEAKRS